MDMVMHSVPPGVDGASGALVKVTTLFMFAVGKDEKKRKIPANLRVRAF